MSVRFSISCVSAFGNVVVLHRDSTVRVESALVARKLG
jgi:hypothetical protein